MICIDSTASLEAILDEAASPQIRVAMAYTEITQATAALTGPYMANVATNSTTAVSLLSAPSSGVSRQLATLSARNIDDIAHVITIRSNVSSTYTQHVVATLQVNETLTYEHGRGWTVLDATGVPKIPNQGTVVQVVHASTGSVATGTTTTPLDDTIPQNNEGTEFITATITPTKTSNRLLIEFFGAAGSSANGAVITALFQDSTASALNANGSYQVAGSVFSLALIHEMQAGTTSSTTFKIRIGCNNAATITLNGASSARLFGGVEITSLRITEIAA